MNIEDLKQTLTQIAHEVDTQDQTSRLRAVDAKVTANRRRRIGVGAGVVAASAALALVVPGLVDGGRDPGPASSTLPTVEDHGISFYTSPAGNTLVGEAVAPTGQRSVTLRVVAPSTDLSYQSVCWQSGAHAGQEWYHITVNGHAVAGISCGERPGTLGSGDRFGFSPRANRAFWRNELGVVPGEQVTLRAFFRPRQQTSGPPTQLGIALYDETGPMVRVHGRWLPRQTVFAGHAYALARTRFSRVSGLSGDVSLDLPPAEKPLYVVKGVADVHGPYRTSSADSSSAVGASTGSETGDLVPTGQRFSSMSIHLSKAPGALIYLLAYKRID